MIFRSNFIKNLAKWCIGGLLQPIFLYTRGLKNTSYITVFINEFMYIWLDMMCCKFNKSLSSLFAFKYYNCNATTAYSTVAIVVEIKSEQVFIFWCHLQWLHVNSRVCQFNSAIVKKFKKKCWTWPACSSHYVSALNMNGDLRSVCGSLLIQKVSWTTLILPWRAEMNTEQW